MGTNKRTFEVEDRLTKQLNARFGRGVTPKKTTPTPIKVTLPDSAKKEYHKPDMSVVDAWLSLTTNADDICVASFVRDIHREPTLAERIRIGKAREDAKALEARRKENIAAIVGSLTKENVKAALHGESINKDTQLRTPSIDTEETEEYNFVEHPKHYNDYDVEVVDMMERIWGPEDTATWCKLTAFKYRMRMGLKPTDDITQDLAKEKWYKDKAKELKKKINK